MKKNDIVQFFYTEKDLHFKIECKSEDSKFDKELKEKWNKIEKENILRYSVKCQKCKVIEGKYGFFAQLNIERATLRRKPEEIMTMFTPFDPNRFNFTMISDKEILFDIGNGDGNDVVTVNDSPILWSHCLLLTQRFNYLPQQITLYSFQKALEILLLSNSENMRILFNSLCASASVNHLHWHFYYLDYRMLLEQIPLQHFVGLLYTFENYPAKGFCLKLSSFKDKSIDKYTTYAYNIVFCLQKNEIAHNIYITRSKTDTNQKDFDDIRIYIWARTHSYGIKNAEDFTIAACELFGHLPIRTKEAYIGINEDYVSNRLEQITFSSFLSTKEILMKLLQEDIEKKNTFSDK